MSTTIEDIKQHINLELLAKQLVEGFITGLHKSPYHGFSVEFAEHRLYNNGESTKHIDWKVYARTDRLYTKQYEEETNLRCMVVMDTSSSMFYPTGNFSKINFSIYAAAALSYLLQRQRDAIGLCLFSDKIDQITPIKSTPSHLDKLMVIMEKLRGMHEQVRSTNVARVLHEIAEKVHKRSLVVIFSDMFDDPSKTEDLFKSLQHLKHNKHEVVVFHVMDNATELNFEFDDRPTEFIDLESGDKLKLNPADVKESYRNQAAEYYKALKLHCNRLKVDFVEVDVRKSFDVILQTYLIKRAKMS